MKGIILAGGSGTRLYPLTRVISKQLLPVYDKPMIYYPLSTLMLFGIRDILIISTPRDTPHIEKLFGNGKKLGLNIQYAIQPEPKGIAQAFIIGADFIDHDDVCLILGDNIFRMLEALSGFRKEVDRTRGTKATVFACHVPHPERFGVIEFDRNFRASSIEEKPKNPKSSYVTVGLYFYPGDVVERARQLVPSTRGELEITDLNNQYLREGKISVVPMRRGNIWLDAGTPASLMEASMFISLVEQRQGVKVACIEEVAYRMGFIDDEQMMNLIREMKAGTSYRDYLEKVYKERHEPY